MTTIELPTPDPRTLDDSARPFAEAIDPLYAVKRVIGRGGMGVVYLARDRRLDRLVAIKTLLPDLAADPVVRERFLRETRTAAGLAHPNIVPVHGADDIGGHVFYSMAYVDGESLGAHIRARGQLPYAEVVRILRDVGAGLAHAHSRGIVHRDIKIENILIERATGTALVADFGIARLAAAGPLTATGQLLGTVHYVSPEHVTGGTVDERSDIYSLGVVAYLALSGRFPFDADVASAVLVSHVTKTVPPLSAIVRDAPVALLAVIERCLAKDPAQRFANVDAMLYALSAATKPVTRQSDAAGVSTVVSATEARALWKRAAELQAATGIQARPLIVPRERERNHLKGAGFRVDDVRAAANEAGIDAEYVDHALAEHGLAPVSATRANVGRSPFWAGVPLDIVKEATIEGEVQPRDFERFINAMRDSTGTLGVTTARSREVAWHGRWFGHRLDVSIIPKNGTTTIRLSQNMRRAAIATVGSAVTVTTAVAALVPQWVMDLIDRPSIVSWSLSQNGLRAIAISAGVAVLVSGIPLGRRLLARIRRKGDAEVTALTQALAEKARLYQES